MKGILIGAVIGTILGQVIIWAWAPFELCHQCHVPMWRFKTYSSIEFTIQIKGATTKNLYCPFGHTMSGHVSW